MLFVFVMLFFLNSFGAINDLTLKEIFPLNFDRAHTSHSFNHFVFTVINKFTFAVLGLWCHIKMLYWHKYFIYFDTILKVSCDIAEKISFIN